MLPKGYGHIRDLTYQVIANPGDHARLFGTNAFEGVYF